MGHKVTLPEQKDTLFKMLRLVIVKFLSCLRFKTLKTIARSVAHNSYCFGQIQYRSQLADNVESVPAGTGVFVTFSRKTYTNGFPFNG